MVSRMKRKHLYPSHVANRDVHVQQISWSTLGVKALSLYLAD